MTPIEILAAHTMRIRVFIVMYFFFKCEHSSPSNFIASKSKVQLFLLSKLGQSTETNDSHQLTFPNNLTCHSDLHLTHITIFTNLSAPTCQFLTQKLGTHNSFISIICHYLHSHQFQKKVIARDRSPISSVSENPNCLHVYR